MSKFTYKGPTVEAIIEALGRHRFAKDAAADLGLTVGQFRHYRAYHDIVATRYRARSLPSPTKNAVPSSTQIAAEETAAAVTDYWDGRGYQVDCYAVCERDGRGGAGRWLVRSDLVNGLPRDYVRRAA